MNSKTRSPRRWLVTLARATGLLAVAFAVGWSAATVFASPTPTTTAPSYLLVTSRVGAVEEEIPLKVTAQWLTDAEMVNQSSGVVTSVEFAPGAKIHAGDRLYTVGLRPVFAAVGAVPSFRSITEGDKGRDVQQLQQLLLSAGHLVGQPDGSFGPATTRAVKEWQGANDLEPDGNIAQADIVYFPSLPAYIALDPKLIAVGKTVVGGESGIRALRSEPTFQAPIAALQAGLLPEGTPVKIGDKKWSAVVTDHVVSEDGNVLVDFAAPEEGSICGEECGSVPIDNVESLDAMAMTVAPQSGVVIPTGAIRTNADGSTVVSDRRGRNIPVKIVASARGQSIVDGIPAGISVRIEKNK